MNPNAPFQLATPIEIVIYVLLAVVCIAILALIIRDSRRKAGESAWFKWTTQDILVVAIMGVLLEVYDNLIGDQFITPLIEGIPFAHDLAVNDLPYMFLLMVGIAIIRKPGAATAMVFLNFLLMQLLYGGSKATPLFWLYGLLQGIFVDLYILLRRGRVFSRNGLPAVVDGLIMGALRAFPAVMAESAIISPLLTGHTKTGQNILIYTVLNVIGNGLAAAITAPIAVRIAKTVLPARQPAATRSLITPKNQEVRA